tara:strand:- start:418 stop:1518 length:1101 start_codon:yes stop_codon:yes gene_type:complete
MKILQVINSMAMGGAEKLLVDTIPLLEKQGIEVDILLLNGANHPFKTKLVSSMQGQIISLGERSVYSPLNILGLKKNIKHYDIVHVHLFPALYWVALAKIFSGYQGKLVFTEHNIINKRFERNWTKVIDRFFYQKYDKLIGITNKIKSFIGQRFQMEDSTVLIENGVNIKSIQEERGYSHTELSEICGQDLVGKKVLLQVSAFRPQKDQLTLIRSLEFLDDNVILVLVGAGELYEETKITVSNLKYKDRVVFLGLCSGVPRLLKSSDVVVLSSKYEGMSLSSIEGMACGRPFVASDVPGLSEIVKGAGVLFPQGDEKKLAEEISRLLHDKKYYHDVAQKCIARASDYDISRMVQKHVDLYESLSKA